MQNFYREESSIDIKMPLVDKVGFQIFNQGQELIWHKHNGYELTYAIKGRLSWEIEDGKILDINSCNGAITMPNIKHQSINGVTMPCQSFWIVLDLDNINNTTNTPFTKSDLEIIANHLSTTKNRTFNVSIHLNNTLKELKDHIISDKENDLLYYSKLRCLLSQILLKTYSSLLSLPNKTSIESLKIIKEYVLLNYASEITITKLCELANRSQPTLYNLFREQLGQTPIEYIQSIRIEKAMYLLTNTTKSITSIAFDVGFSSSQYFSKIFSKYAGHSPSTYRINSI